MAFPSTLFYFLPEIHLLPDNIFPKDTRHHHLLSPTTCFSGLEGTLPQFHMHPSDAYEIATLFLFSSFLYRRINSAPFSMPDRNTTHPPPTERGQKKALALYFMYQIRKKKWSFSTPLFFLRPNSSGRNSPRNGLIHRRKCGNFRC